MKGRSSRSSAIFENEDGTPRQFYILPCELKAQLRTLIEAEGGSLSSKYFPGAIKLIEPRACSSERTYKDYISTNFIFNCVSRGEFLNTDDYRIENEKVDQVGAGEDACSSRVQSSTITTSNLISGRQKYIPAEDLAIIDFVNKNCTDKLPVGGNALWKLAESEQVTIHSWQSMRDRFHKHLKRKKKTKYSKEVVTTCVGKGFQTKVAASGQIKSKRPYITLDVTTKSQELRGKEYALARDDVTSVSEDRDEKPPKQLNKKDWENKTSGLIRKQGASIFSDSESDVNDSPDSLDKKLISFASEQSRDTWGSSETLSCDVFYGVSASNQITNKKVISNCQGKCNHAGTQASITSNVKPNSKLEDFKGTASLKQRVTKEAVKELHLNGRANVHLSVTVNQSSKSTTKYCSEDNLEVVSSTDGNLIAPYRSKLRKRKSFSPENQNKFSDSEADYENLSVKTLSLSPSSVKRSEKHSPMLRRSPRKKMIGLTTNNHQYTRESENKSCKSDKNATRHGSPKKLIGSAVEHNSDSDGVGSMADKNAEKLMPEVSKNDRAKLTKNETSSENQSKLIATILDSVSDSETNSEDVYVKSPSLLPLSVASSEKQSPVLRRSPRIKRKRLTTDNHQHTKESGKEYGRSDDNASKPMPRRKLAESDIAEYSDSESTVLDDKGKVEGVLEDFGLIMAEDFKELLTISDASLEEIMHNLFMSSGSVLSTKRYLLTGRILSDIWTWEEDQMLLTENIHKVIKVRGLKKVCERVEFLGNGSFYHQ